MVSIGIGSVPFQKSKGKLSSDGSGKVGYRGRSGSEAIMGALCTLYLQEF
jgi:hypothetical protein